MIRRHFALIITALISSLLLTSCKTKLQDEAIIPPQESYDTGVALLTKGEHKKAAESFEKVFLQHPGHAITPQAELMRAYALYLGGEYDDAVDTLNIFIRLHPRHHDIAYAYYLRGMSSYVQISETSLDQSKTRQAKEGLEELVQRFPNTKYATDARLKMDLVNAHLAGKEMNVGRYYLKKKNPIAAMKRFQAVIDHYGTSPHAQEALYRLVESNVMLGLSAEAGKYLEVLGYNYPEGVWYERAKALVGS